MKFKLKKATPLILLSGVLALSGCASSSGNSESSNIQDEVSVSLGEYSIDFDSENYEVKTTTVNGETLTYRAYENIVYVSNPVDIEYQTLNFYVPESYFNGETINGYTIDTAPILFANSVGGYMPAAASSIDAFTDAGFSVGGLSLEELGESSAEESSATSNGEDGENTFVLALSRGYVVASVGVRGRTNQDEDGNYTGKAPAAIVDLKAAVRYLRYNDDVMAGDANKIISNGTSAGGALSLLLGATGNSEDYESYLEELGAAPASDDIFAVNAFCPITNLENADMAYEWQFNESTEYKGRESGSLTDTQIEYSNELKTNFIAYLNSLNLVDSEGNSLNLDEDGNGSFKDYIATYVIASAQSALDSGEDLSSYDWLEISGGKVTGINLDAYFLDMGRSKVTPAFDTVDLSSGENSLFGTESVNAQHFTQFGFDNSTEGGTLADSQIIKLMNPLNYIGDSSSTNSTYWRIRHGSIDSDTSLAIPTIIATILEENGYNVDFALQWNTGHTGDYDLTGFFDWIDSIAR